MLISLIYWTCEFIADAKLVSARDASGRPGQRLARALQELGPSFVKVGQLLSVRPDVVRFGETPYFLDEIATVLMHASQFVAIGTSGQVYPAASFVDEARANGASCLEINVEETAISSRFDDMRLGVASEVVPDWAAEVLSAR